MAVGCNHGSWADKSALAGVMEFKRLWNPETRIHLGDYMDTTSFRNGAGIKDHLGEIKDDLLKGVEFLEQYEPTLLFNGNHDIRVWESLDDSNAHRRFAAQEIIKSVRDAIGKKTEFVEDYNIKTSVRTIGDTNVLHGFMYNENAVRDHAAHFGKCLFAHLHKVAAAPASRMDSPVGYCVGYLGDESKFDYAARRRALAQWSQGLAYGEYNDKECMIWLIERSKGGEWRFPI